VSVASTKDKVRTALDETRILILGAQILLGFQFNAAFLPKFAHLPEHIQWLNAAAFTLILAAVGLLIAPAPFHRIVEDGNDTGRVHRFATRMSALALAPFALCIVADILIADRSMLGVTMAGVLGATALFLWYGIEFMKRDRRPISPQAEPPTSIKEKIDTIGTEARIILPGAQALLGFQFSAVLTDSFDKLPDHAKAVHFAALCCIGLAVILLMSPAAYHRIAANGESRPDVDTFAVWMVLGSLVPLSLGLAADFYLVIGMIADWSGAGAGIAAVLVLALWALWFGYPVYARRHGGLARHRTKRAQHHHA
jgi:hypothetical protein